MVTVVVALALTTMEVAAAVDVLLSSNNLSHPTLARLQLLNNWDTKVVVASLVMTEAEVFLPVAAVVADLDPHVKRHFFTVKSPNNKGRNAANKP